MRARGCLALVFTGAVAMAPAAVAGELRVSSPDLAAGGTIAARHVYSGYGCDGGNTSPTLAWSGAPAGTRSFAVTVHDPDAPRAGGWWHWLVHSIPADVTRLARGASGGGLPGGAVETRTSFDERGYGGPCPPPGDPPHRYRFTVYALDTTTLDVAPDAPPAKVAEHIRAHALARARLTARYGR